MAIQKSVLQQRAATAPPRKESYEDWLKKMLSQQVAGGIVQFGTQASVDWATSDMQRDRQIAVNESGSRIQIQGRITQDAIGDVRGSIQDVFGNEARLNDELGTLRELRTIVARSQKSVSGSRTYITVQDIAEAAGILTAKLENLRKSPVSTEGMSKAAAMQTTQKYGARLRRLESMVGKLKSAQHNKSAIRSPALAQQMFELIIREGEDSIIQSKADNWKMLTERININVAAAGKDEAGQQRIQIDREALNAAREKRNVMAMANAANVWRREAILREHKKNPEAFERLVASGKLKDVQLKAGHIHPALLADKENPAYKKYGWLFDAPLARHLNVADPEKWDKTTYNRPWIQNAGHVPNLTKDDRKDAKVVQTTGAPAPREVIPGWKARPYKNTEEQQLRIIAESPEGGPEFREHWEGITKVRQASKDVSHEMRWKTREDAKKGVYKVKNAGSTLADVAKAAGVPVVALQRINRRSDGSLYSPTKKFKKDFKLKVPIEYPEYTPYAEFFTRLPETEAEALSAREKFWAAKSTGEE